MVNYSVIGNETIFISFLNYYSTMYCSQREAEMLGSQIFTQLTRRAYQMLVANLNQNLDYDLGPPKSDFSIGISCGTQSPGPLPYFNVYNMGKLSHTETRKNKKFFFSELAANFCIKFTFLGS